MSRVILITGGQRSGKSAYAEQLALSLAENPVYMATARIWDEEFRQRVCRHQERRGPQWTNIEEPLQLSRHNVEGRVVLVDCITLWLTNFYFSEAMQVEAEQADNMQAADMQSDAEQAAVFVDRVLAMAKAEFDRLTAQPQSTFIFVTNEIGSGGVSDNALQRRFTDLQGWMNQYVAARADEVVLMVSGIPVKIK